MFDDHGLHALDILGSEDRGEKGTQSPKSKLASFEAAQSSQAPGPDAGTPENTEDPAASVSDPSAAVQKREADTPPWARRMLQRRAKDRAAKRVIRKAKGPPRPTKRPFWLLPMDDEQEATDEMGGAVPPQPIGPLCSELTLPLELCNFTVRLTSWQVTSQVHLAQTVKMWLPYSGLLPGRHDLPMTNPGSVRAQEVCMRHWYHHSEAYLGSSWLEGEDFRPPAVEASTDVAPPISQEAKVPSYISTQNEPRMSPPSPAWHCEGNPADPAPLSFARKRSYKRAVRRAAQHPDQTTTYRGRQCTLRQLCAGYQGSRPKPKPEQRAQADALHRSQDRLLVMTWNAGGLSSDLWHELLLKLQHLPPAARPQILCVQESYWKDTVAPTFVTANWQVYCSPATDSKSAGLITY
ncbi:hypothetical protein AK812_SmicGene40480 [Symbiodinium microadriaticum]|uniref:Endonuclease/exonuclease/phosphatase domain-containing protein n=1 Tax=Symbiodinium microadriaticum TaxID=2951 RepID=A0A1Q9C8I0_SYMMI|nr:hypothetical protein AK812_SmicGene40480 [Symbiodinium microadriaticum]